MHFLHLIKNYVYKHLVKHKNYINEKNIISYKFLCDKSLKKIQNCL